MGDKVREWINTSISISMLVIAIIGLFIVEGELTDININIQNLSQDQVKTEKVIIVDEQGNDILCIQNRSFYTGNCLQPLMEYI